MIILDGKKIAKEILRDIGKEISMRGLKLKLAVILVGKVPVSRVFVGQKEKACKETGIDFELFEFSSGISESDLKNEIKKIANNADNSGLVIQLPLPEKFNAQDFLNLIPGEKDVDVLSEKTIKKFSQGNLPILPPTVAAISTLFKEYRIKVKGKNIVVVGAGRLVGKPLATWLKQQKAKFFVLDKTTKNLASFTEKADILISGVGKPNLINDNMVKDGVVAIDAGSSSKNNKTVGDIDFESVSKKASYITPVPGGVGPLTVACLLENLMKFV